MKKLLILGVLILSSCSYQKNKKSDVAIFNDDSIFVRNNITKINDSLSQLNITPLDKNIFFAELKENQIASEGSKLELVSELTSIGKYRFVIINESNNICENAYLICAVGNKLHSIYMVKSNCDSDLSYYKYEFWDYKLGTDSNCIIIKKHSETVKNKNSVDTNGFILNGANREDSDLIIDTFKINLKTKDLINKIKYFPHLNYPNYIVKKY